MNNNVDLEKTLNKWAEDVIKQWHMKIIALNINETHGLFNSFYWHVHTNANGDPDRIDFAFKYYGKFVDMGVGKGVNLENRLQLISMGVTRRRQKEWYSKVFFGQTQYLKQILSQKYAMKASLAIINNLESFDLDGNKSSKSSQQSTNKAARDYDRARGR